MPVTINTKQQTRNAFVRLQPRMYSVTQAIMFSEVCPVTNSARPSVRDPARCYFPNLLEQAVASVTAPIPCVARKATRVRAPVQSGNVKVGSVFGSWSSNPSGWSMKNGEEDVNREFINERCLNEGFVLRTCTFNKRAVDTRCLVSASHGGSILDSFAYNSLYQRSTRIRRSTTFQHRRRRKTQEMTPVCDGVLTRDVTVVDSLKPAVRAVWLAAPRWPSLPRGGQPPQQ